MGTVTLKLYGTLNLYTPDRQRIFSVQFQPPAATAREVLRRVGMPLDLLEMVARNGEAVDLDATVTDGDLLEAFPLIGGGQGDSCPPSLSERGG